MIKGSYHTEETKRKMSEAHKGLRHTIETKKKLSEHFSGKNNPMYGRYHTIESKQKMSEFRKRFRHTFETKQKMSEARKGNKNSNWRGGIRKLYKGYLRKYCPTHPYNKENYVLLHRFVMEEHLGRYLKPKEVVHHINNNSSDNRIENLMLFNSPGEHSKHHFKKGGI